MMPMGGFVGAVSIIGGRKLVTFLLALPGVDACRLLTAGPGW
jgi:hypothetical protein